MKGSRAYSVNLVWRDSKLNVTCDCPYFYDRGEPCKHLWASVLAADAKGYLSGVAEPANLEYSVDLEDEGLLEDFGDEDDPFEELKTSSLPKSAKAKSAPLIPNWKMQLDAISANRSQQGYRGSEWPVKREIVYIVDVDNSIARGGLIFSFASRDYKKNGEVTAPKILSMQCSSISQLPSPEDREIFSMLSGGKAYYSYINAYERFPNPLFIPPVLARTVMPLVVRTGRCYLPPEKEGKEKDGKDMAPLVWDDGDPWKFVLEMRRGSYKEWELAGCFRRGEEWLDANVPVLVTLGSFLFTRDRVALLAEDVSWEWISHFRKSNLIQVPEEDQEEFLRTILNSSNAPPLEVPEELQYEEIVIRPKPCLRLDKPGTIMRADRLAAYLSFAYEGQSASETSEVRGFYDAAARRFVRRDLEAERAATELLRELGVKRASSNGSADRPWELAPARLPVVARSLITAGWHVEADGKLFHSPGEFRLGVSSGIDWFELHGEVAYGDARVTLPQLLEALRRGNNMVLLDDGSYGMLPEEWLERIGAVAGMGELQDGHVRFRQSQAGLLDALLATQPQVSCDETFSRVREELQRFEGIAPAEQPQGFVGQLRDYQREGLGWMHFLRRFSFGGCLADDMGVGKTAQVLALLETRRELRVKAEVSKPSLVVVPKSLIFNWKQEAARFTPALRMLDYTGTARDSNELTAYDVILTTYGTLRRDALHFKDVEFDYVILDEAQAIKNASTESAKAARLLRGTNRLALSGTPVENHLGELWSLFEFLNPGMLGAASVFTLTEGAMRNPDENTRKMLAYALRPFVLRRTKEQVASELPPKSEQTIYCEMSTRQRQLYDELRQHYQEALLKKVKRDGLAKSKILVLEALLRLRQAACHPGLLDPDRRNDPSAKTDMLLDQLVEILEEGHKALVFSQFTSLLAIVRSHLESKGITYEYLDGKTRDRQGRVERFQNDPACRLFLISLKAGGLGLNLTAADYVFILDPWWNPAVEAQAVDRAHRIGQSRQVCAYRLIARNTIEEKVLELQNTKKDLASAIVGAENSLIRDLRPEDLELLLS